MLKWPLGIVAASWALCCVGLALERNRAGDVTGAVEAVVDDYETTGDAVVRLLALEERMPSLQPLLARGRKGHRDWVEAMFRAPGLTPELVVATDVYTWKLLRRDQGLSRDETVASILKIVEALLERRTR